MNFRRAVVFTALFLTFASAQAPKQAIFITAEQLNMSAILPSPPVNESEVAALHKLESARTPAMIARAQADDAEESMFFFQTILGPKFDREKLPLTALLSDHVHNDESIIVNPAKTFFHRARPYHFDKTLKPVCKTKDSTTDYAYPSGHATTGYLEALTLMMILPEKRDEIMARADDYAHNRLVCEAHYPSDLEASKATAYAMMSIMANHPQFKKELAAAREETRKALGM